MKGLFDLVSAQQGEITKARDENDFDDETHLEFECGDSTYIMDYAADGTFDFKLVPTKRQTPKSLFFASRFRATPASLSLSGQRCGAGL